MIERQCATCKEMGPIADFAYKNSKTPKFYHECKGCRSKRYKKYRKTHGNRESRKAYCNNWYAKNRERAIQSAKNWRIANPEKRRNRVLIYNYGLSLEDYLELLNAQGGVCAICERQEAGVDHRTGKTRGLHVDHDHKTGEIRGLLCSTCNLAIGYVNDDPCHAEALAAYLRAFK